MRATWLVIADCVTLVAALFLCRPAGADNTASVSQQAPIHQTLITPPAAARAAADKGLKTLSQLGRDDDKEAQELGFTSASEKAGELGLGDALPIFWVSSKKLRNFQGSDPTDLLEQANLVIYPVTVGGEVRSSLTVKQSRTDKERWQAVEFGAASFVRLLEKYKKTSDANVVVWIPGLNRYFLGRLEGKLLRMTAIVEDPRLSLKAGQTVSKEQVKVVFTKLQAEAKASKYGQKKRPGQGGQEKQGGKK